MFWPAPKWWKGFSETASKIKKITTMKKKLHSFRDYFLRLPLSASCFLVIGFLLNWHPLGAQTFTLTMVSDTIACGMPGDAIYVYGELTNTTASPQIMDIIRAENNVPPDWETALCMDVCYVPSVDSFQASFSANESKTFIFHFYTDTIAGNGNGLVQFKNVADPTETMAQRFYGKTDCIVGFSENEPAKLLALGNDPNPVFSSTTIHFSLAQAGEISLSVHDMAGRLVEMLVNESKGAGTHRVLFDTKNLPTGTYFILARTSHSSRVGKFQVVK